MVSLINSSSPDKMADILADYIFKRIFLNENIWISNKISLKYVPWGLIENMLALVQIMAWRRTGDKPLSEPMLTQFTDAYMRHLGRSVYRKIPAKFSSDDYFSDEYYIIGYHIKRLGLANLNLPIAQRHKSIVTDLARFSDWSYKLHVELVCWLYLSRHSGHDERDKESINIS